MICLIVLIISSNQNFKTLKMSCHVHNFSTKKVQQSYLILAKVCKKSVRQLSRNTFYGMFSWTGMTYEPKF